MLAITLAHPRVPVMPGVCCKALVGGVAVTRLV